jgi:MYXO-CTERM domain-containing protein
MVSLPSHRNLFVSGFVGALAFVAPAAYGATYHYVDWQSADVASGTAAGVITLADDSQVTVTFTALNADGSPGNLYGAQAESGIDYWTPTAPYLSQEVENAPPPVDLVQLSGGQNQTYVVELSEPIKDPTMAIVSLGQASLPTDYDFDAPFEIVSQGAGYWGGTDTALEAVEGDILRGSEGHGTIRFLGTFGTFSWTVPTPESWHGFTFGIRTTERLEPTPVVDAGGLTHVDASSPAPVDGGATDATDLVSAIDAAASDDAGVDEGSGGLDVDIDDVVSDASPLVDAAPDAVHRDASAPVTRRDSGVSDTESSDADATDVDCSCRTVGRDSSHPGWSLVASLALVGLAVSRRRRSR